MIGKDGKINEGSGWIVPGHFYNAIRQDGIFLSNGKPNPAAAALLDYLKLPEAKAIIRS